MVEQFLATVSPVGRVAYILFLLENELKCLTANVIVPPSDDYQTAVDELQLLINTMPETCVHSPLNYLSDSSMKKLYLGVITRWTMGDHGDTVLA